MIVAFSRYLTIGKTLEAHLSVTLSQTH